MSIDLKQELCYIWEVMRIDALDIFELLLHRDAETFHLDEAVKQRTWDSIEKEFTEKKMNKVDYRLEETNDTKQTKEIVSSEL